MSEDSFRNGDCDPIYDVIIIGAGACGLAIAARLREKSPSALFTDDEQARYSWISKRQASIKSTRGGRVKNVRSNDDSPSVLVLDSSGSGWMTRWNALFDTFRISHLRSPMFFHLDPSDRDSLLAFAHVNGRADELEEIAGCVGREISKHKRKKRTSGRRNQATPVVTVDERDRKDYFAPSSRCFQDFCQQITVRYGLQGSTIRQETVRDIDYDYSPRSPGDDRLFSIKTSHSQYLSRTVILATGPGAPFIPKPFPPRLPRGASHSMEIAPGALIDRELMKTIQNGRTTNVLVIGGGLTSAQITCFLLKNGVGRVWMFMRGPWKVKPFDVDLSWMSKFKNHQRATFWTSDSFEERASIIREARNGGSITPGYTKRLQEFIRKGQLSVYTSTTVKSFSRTGEDGPWSITADPPIENLPQFDHIYLATGSKADVNEIEFLQTMIKEYPTHTVSGFPTLTDELMWTDGVPLFLTGTLASLQLGPGAANLEGARLSAERIAWAIQKHLRCAGCPSREGECGSEGDQSMEDRYMRGLGNKFEGLDMHD